MEPTPAESDSPDDTGPCPRISNWRFLPPVLDSDGCAVLLGMKSGREVLRVAREHGYLVSKFEDGEAVIRCRTVRGFAGFWFVARKSRWGYYHPARKSPKADMRGIRVVGRALRDPSPINATGPHEILIHCRPKAALALMAAGPRHLQAKPTHRRSKGGPEQGGSEPRTPDLPLTGPGTLPGASAALSGTPSAL